MKECKVIPTPLTQKKLSLSYIYTTFFVLRNDRMWGLVAPNT